MTKGFTIDDRMANVQHPAGLPLQELDSLAASLSTLTNQFGEAADQFRASGLLPSQTLMGDLAERYKGILNLLTRILRHTQRLLASMDPPSAAPAPQNVLRRSLQSIAKEEEEPEGLFKLKENAMAVLDRVLCIQHREDARFPPLLGCQAKARRIRQEILRSPGSEFQRETPQISQSVQAFSRLLVLIEPPDNLSDDQWLEGQELVAEEFGRALAIAAARGKLELDTSFPPVALPGEGEVTELPEPSDREESSLTGPLPSVGPEGDAQVCPPPTLSLPAEEEIRQEVEAILAEITQQGNIAVDTAEEGTDGTLTPLAQFPLELGNAHTEVGGSRLTCVPENSDRSNLAEHHPNPENQAEAGLLLERPLPLAQGTRGLEDPDIATILGSRAVVYHAQGKYADAELLYQQALVVRERTLGTDHPKVATTLNNLAVLYRDQGKYAQAQTLCERSLAIVQKALGSTHPKVARRIGNLADIYWAQDQYDDAEALYQQVLAILERTDSRQGGNLVAASLKNYVSLLRKMNRKNEAESIEARIREITSHGSFAAD